jgi:hypothetical protein
VSLDLLDRPSLRAQPPSLESFHRFHNGQRIGRIGRTDRRSARSESNRQPELGRLL